MKFRRLLLSIIAFFCIICNLVILSDTMPVLAKSSKETVTKDELPSEKILKEYAEKYIGGIDWDYYPILEAFTKLTLTEKAEVFAAAQKCSNYMEKHGNNQPVYIGELAYFCNYLASDFSNGANFIDIIPLKNAGKFFRILSSMVGKSRYGGSAVDSMIDAYRSCVYNEFGGLYNKWVSVSETKTVEYDTVPYTFLLTDRGKITKGAKYCKLVGEIEHDYGLKLRTYMVTQPCKIETYDMSGSRKYNCTYKLLSLSKGISKYFIANPVKLDTKNLLIVDKANEESAKEIDGLLNEGKDAVIQIRGEKKDAIKVINELREIIKKVNKQGVVFQYTLTRDLKNCYFHITKDDAKLYKYSNQFIKKLYQYYLDNEKEYEDDNSIYDIYDTSDTYGIYGNDEIDSINYPDEKERLCRIIYDNSVRTLYEMYGYYFYDNVTITGADPATTYTYMEIADPYKVLKSTDVYDDITFMNVMSYDEFASLTDTGTSAKSEPENFYELSDAMKIYVIDKTRYFDCRFTKSEFGMLYVYKYDSEEGYKGMKLLLDGEASGVCQVYAEYEKLVFDQLGIECYPCSNSGINHAWTVVRATNSKGKELWIPFDYGIGPSTGLAVSDEVWEKYLSTEEARYELYLHDIEYAPKYKNFTDEDFN